MILAQAVLEICNSEAVGGGIFDRFFNFDKCQQEVVSDIITGMAVQDVNLDLCGNFGDSRLKQSEASFSAILRTSITSDRKKTVTTYTV